MLALEVEYLMGRVIASCHDDRKMVEWPPHPARLFAALVAAFKECALGDTVRDALEWLETQPEPGIYANPPEHGGWVRDVHQVFVPINDSNDQQSQKKKKYSAISSGINFRRNRQERFFPAYTPNDKTVYFIWNDAALDEQKAKALQEAAENVTYLGHSMSPVRVSVRRGIPENNAPTLTPHPQGTLLLRTTGQGRLDYLETLHLRRSENASLQPRLGRVSEYRITGESISPPPRSFFQRIYIIRKEQGCRLPLESAYGLCSLVRKALLERCADPLPESISGHLPNGEPSNQPHLAIMPLANVGHRHADGHIMGFAVLFPEHADVHERKQLEQGLRKLQRITLGFLGEWQVSLLDAESLEAAAKTLQPETYSAAHKHWATVTPVVFGHYPKNKPGKDALAIIGQACRDIGLPQPVDVNIMPGSHFNSAPQARDFKRSADFQRVGHLKEKMLAHITLSFDQTVQGPIILGAGRFLGLGVCRPVIRKEPNHASK